MPEARFLYRNCLGGFAFDRNNSIVDSGSLDELKKKHPEAEIITMPSLQILEAFKYEKHFKKFREYNIELAKKKVKESFTRDQLIVQTVSVIEDLDKAFNSLVKRLRDWYALQSPEIVHALEGHERFVKSVVSKEPKELIAELNLDGKMGADLPSDDYGMIMQLAHMVEGLNQLKDEQDRYLEVLMKEIAPNVHAIAGTMIGAKLISIARGLEKLSKFPASTLQLLGAEKALFRHLKTGAKSPKYGVLIMHPLVANAKKSDKGKVARALADKISIASKVDYFRGDPIGEKLRKDMEAKFG
ncbi:MAG: NOP5/NOP56 family protein [Candidatus Nanoarchaeia archaeon]